MASQGFFSPEKKRMAGEKENKPFFSVEVKPVTLANNINKYNDQTPSLDDGYAPDRVESYIQESETRPSYTPKEDTGYGASLEKGIDNLSGLEKSFYGVDKATKEYGVPMSKEEKRVTTAYKLANPDVSWKDRYKFSDTNYNKIQADYDKYKDLRDRRETRKEAEDAVTKFRSDAMADFDRADYAIRMKQYNPDGTEKDINKYNVSLDEQINNLNRLRQTADDFGPNYSLDRFGNVLPRSEVDAYNRKVDAEEAERTRLSKEKAKANYEESQKNVFQKIGDTVGNIFNKLTGTEAVGAGTLQAQGINTGATVNLSQMGNVSPTVQAARDAVAKANLRKSGLDRTIGGQSSQANYGRASRGFGTGTHGKGMSSNPGSQRQTGVGKTAGNLSRHKAGHSSSQPSSSKSRSQGRGGRRGGSSGGSGSSSKGGTGKGQSRSGGTTGRKASKASKGRTGRSRSQCDIRTKIDISPLINSNLVKDNLAEVAYFVQEIKK